MIYCGYQGCGKSTYCKNHPEITVDLDSSMFKKRDGWEIDYILIAKLLSDAGKKVFISAHRVVINRLLENNIPFELLIPAQNPEAWRSRLEFRYNLNPTQANKNAIIDFDKNHKSDMDFYNSLTVTKHYISATIITDIGNFV